MDATANSSTAYNPEGSVICRFAIIGGGFTAVSMLCQLVDQLERIGGEGRALGARLAIDLFEKHGAIGPGLPHNGSWVMPFHITNMCAKDMSVRISRPDDFQSWVCQNIAALNQRVGEQNIEVPATDIEADQCSHYPREVMGEYLKSQFDDAVSRLKELGSSLKIRTNCEVIDLWLEDSFLHLTSRERTLSQTEGPFNGALLATGHWFESSPIDNYFTSPWPASKLLAVIPPDSEVSVIGSSLSAIETALTLTSEGLFRRSRSGRLEYVPPPLVRKLKCFSRRGLIPRVRGRIGTRKNQHFTCDRIRKLIADHPHRISLSELFLLLDQELSEAYGTTIDWQQILEPSGSPARILREDIDRALEGDGPDGELVWQTVLVQIFPIVRELYLHLSRAEKKRFDREFNTLFFIHAATQPSINAEKLLALMEAGIVEVTKLGNDYQFGYNELTRKFDFCYHGADGETRMDSFSYCVDARGQPLSIGTDSSELTKSLLARKLVLTETRTSAGDDPEASPGMGSILIDPDTHRVVVPEADNIINPNLHFFAVGAMTRGQIIDSSMALGLARSTAAVAENLISILKSMDSQR